MREFTVVNDVHMSELTVANGVHMRELTLVNGVLMRELTVACGTPHFCLWRQKYYASQFSFILLAIK